MSPDPSSPIQTLDPPGPVRSVAADRSGAGGRAGTALDREWLVTNGLGGYASGTLAGAPTRRYHGLLVAALRAPLGRVLMLMDLAETFRPAGGSAEPARLLELRLDHGLPAWRFRVGDSVVEKRLVLVHGENVASIRYALVDGPSLELSLRVVVDIRGHDAPVGERDAAEYAVERGADGVEVRIDGVPGVRIGFDPRVARFEPDPTTLSGLRYRVEAERGYPAVGSAWSPGRIEARLEPGSTVDVVATVAGAAGTGGTVHGAHDAAPRTPDHDAAVAAELERRRALVRGAGFEDDPLGAELALAADAFIIDPATRGRDRPAQRSVIAGYHWFTDWGRDTMIGLEGLTLATGRHQEAAAILRMFAGHVRDGLIPNLFPEGDDEGLYHTADATLWFFHAVHRYTEWTGDRSLVRELLPKLRAIVGAHLRGTRFGIGVDPEDGLLRQGAPGYQLTWMDAKVDDWVVTPRRGKAVEINALWYNALRLMEGWLREEGEAGADEMARHAEGARSSFNRRFPHPDGHLFDVVDGEDGDDPAFRPNQVFAIALDHPVLEESRWARVMGLVEVRLLTPVGLRSLAPGHPDYAPRYFGDLRARDAAYHQGTVWGWLIGPFVDAWLRVHPGEEAASARFLQGLVEHLDQAGIGTMSEIFDAEPPHTPRGCIAQAWTVAEVLRCHARAAGAAGGIGVARDGVARGGVARGGVARDGADPGSTG